MSLTSLSARSEGEILARVIDPDHGKFPVEFAQSVLSLTFGEADRRRMVELAEKARQGSLASEEQIEIENYERVGHFLSLLQSKARASLKNHAADA